jgi:hypothetical protein
LPEQKRTRNRLRETQHPPPPNRITNPPNEPRTKWPAKATTTRAHRNRNTLSSPTGKLLPIPHTNSDPSQPHQPNSPRLLHNQSQTTSLTHDFAKQPSPRPIPATARLRPTPTSAVWLPTASHGLPTAASAATPTQGEEGPRMPDVLLGGHVLLFLVRGGV